MDIYLNQRAANNQYYYALGQSAAFDLQKTARIVASRHISDLFLKAKFEEEIRRFAQGNLNAIRNAASTSECQQAIDNIKGECANIERQGTMLSLEKAKVFITVSMEKREKEIGYTINAIGVITGALQAYTGIGMAYKSANYIGKFMGAYISLDGASSSIESFMHLIGKNERIGFMKSGYIYSAEFFGFSKKTGLLTYYSADLATSLYGVVKLTLKPDVWRLFRFIPNDYYRKINTMSRGALMLEVISAGNKIRVIHDTYRDNSR